MFRFLLWSEGSASVSYLATTTYDDIRHNPSRIEYYYEQCWDGFADDLGIDVTNDLSDGLLRAAWCSTIASQMFAYGPELMGVIDLPGLLHQSTIACDDFVRVAWLFLDQMPMRAISCAGIGWDGGAVGNHAQWLVSDGISTLLLDPTVALAARVSGDLRAGFNAIASGTPFPRGAISDTFGRYAPRPNVSTFPPTVYSAVLTGAYRPADLLYYWPSLEAFQTPGARENWATPRA